MGKQLKIVTKMTLNPIKHKMNQFVLKRWWRHDAVQESRKG